MTLTVSGEWNAKVRYLTRCFGLLGDRRSCFQGKSFGVFLPSVCSSEITVAPPWESICFLTVQSAFPSNSQIKIFLVLRYWSAWLEKRSPLFVYCLCCCQLWSDVNLLLMVLQWAAAVQHCTTVPVWSASTTMHYYTAGSFVWSSTKQNSKFARHCLFYLFENKAEQ